MAIYDDVKITINLNELVEIRAKLISQYDDYSDKAEVDAGSNPLDPLEFFPEYNEKNLSVE